MFERTTKFLLLGILFLHPPNLLSLAILHFPPSHRIYLGAVPMSHLSLAAGRTTKCGHNIERGCGDDDDDAKGDGKHDHHNAVDDDEHDEHDANDYEHE